MLGRRIVCARSGEEDCVGRLRAEAGDPEKKSVWRLCGRRAQQHGRRDLAARSKSLVWGCRLQGICFIGVRFGVQKLRVYDFGSADDMQWKRQSNYYFLPWANMEINLVLGVQERLLEVQGEAPESERGGLPLVSLGNRVVFLIFEFFFSLKGLDLTLTTCTAIFVSYTSVFPYIIFFYFFIFFSFRAPPFMTIMHPILFLLVRLALHFLTHLHHY